MISKDKTLCLIDGSGYIFRAFYALPPMNRPDGTPVNAVYGFTNMMLNLIHDNCCSHMVVILDAKRKNFRNDIYPEYKANRQETPPDLIPQFPLIRAACDALNVPWLEKEGFEADDLIATYARLATEKGWHATVISADKDLMQLMTPDVSLYDPMKKKMLTDEDVKNKFGVTPDKVVDVQSLMGDSTDNIPGATGIGPKTAAELIQKFGSLHNLLDHLDEIPQPKRREGLIRDKEQILISEKLVSLDKNAPVKPDFEPFAVRPYNTPELATFLTQNGFQSLIKRLQIHTPQPTIEAPKPNKTTYSCMQYARDLKAWLRDIQTLALYPTMLPKTNCLAGLALAKEVGVACYLPLNHKGTADMPALDLFSADNRPPQINPKELADVLIPIFQNKKITKIGHDIKTCWHLLVQFINKDFECTPIADTLLMSYEVDGTKHNHELSDIVPLYLKQELSPLPSKGDTKSVPFDEIPLDQATPYAAERADVILRLSDYLTKRMENTTTNDVYRDIDLPLVPILYHMEKEGILVDHNRLKELNDLFGCRLDALTKEIYQIAGEEFNINSPAQLGVILYEKRGLPGGKRGANGHWITDVKALETLAADNDDILAQKVLQYRSISKLKSTYVDALIERAEKTPRIHTTYSLTATNTGRLASSDPNLQNIPVRTEDGKEIRRVFIAQPGYQILAADYSQIELRLMAEVANVTKLKESFAHNEDIHARTASQVLHIPLEQITPDQRRRAKAINFGIIYGISPFGLAANLGISRGEAKDYIDTYFAEYPEIKQYMTATQQFAETNGFVQTPFGRKVYIPGLDNRATKAFAMRAAINAPIQGGAADIIKKAMIQVKKAIQKSDLDITLLLQVHDELVFEVVESDTPKATDLIKKTMENVVQLSIPLVVDVGIGADWKEAH